MLMKGVTLRGLEVFEAVAATGSVAGAAQATGLSQPAVSQQIRNLETALGVELIEHGRRPMRLTQAGHSYRARAEAALSQLRMAQSEVKVMDLAHVSDLSIGLIDDFDNEVTPRLATLLAKSLVNCRFKLITAPSHQITAALANRELHMAVSASMGQVVEGVTEYPLVRDPFILVAPRGRYTAPPSQLSDLEGLPFLRYDREQIIARMIDRQLARAKIDFEERFEVGSHLALMAMVGRGIGWALTTPLGYMRAERIHGEVEAFPLPVKSFARRIVLYASADWAGDVPDDVARTVRQLVQAHMIDPCLTHLPWLSGELRVLEA